MSDGVRTSTDCFPMEFHDMQAHRRVLYGDDVIAGLTSTGVSTVLKSNTNCGQQIRPRQKAAELLGPPGRTIKAADRVHFHLLCAG